MGSLHKGDALYRIYDYVVMLRKAEWEELEWLIEIGDYYLLKDLKQRLELDGSGVRIGEFNKDRFCQILIFLTRHHKRSMLINRLYELGHMQDLYFKEYLAKIQSDLAMIDALVIP